MIAKRELKLFSICELESIAAYSRSCLLDDNKFNFEHPQAKLLVAGYLNFVGYKKMFIDPDKTKAFIQKMIRKLTAESDRLNALQESDWLTDRKNLRSVMRVLTCRLHRYACRVCIHNKKYGPRDCIAIKKIIDKVSWNIRSKKD